LGSYAGRSCVVSLVVADKTIRSEVVQLQQDAKIDFAIVTGFDRKNIEVEIEFMEPAEQ